MQFKRYILIASILFLSTFSLTQASILDWFKQPTTLGGGSGTIEQIDQWRATSSPSVAITQGVFGKPIKITGLNTGECLTLASNGLATTTGAACGSGSGGGSATTTINGVNGPTFLFDSSAAALNYSTSSGTVSLNLTSGYNIPLTASTTNWNTFFDTPSTRITAGTALGWSGNTLSVSTTTLASTFATGTNYWIPNGNHIYNLNSGSVGINTGTATLTPSRLEVNGDVSVVDKNSVGSNLTVNGTFTGNANNWTPGTGWAYSTNTVVKGSDGTGTLAQDLTYTNTSQVAKNTTYEVAFTISGWTVGSVTPSLGGVTGTAVSANGTYTQYFNTTSNATLAFTPTNTSRFTIDTITRKRVLGGANVYGVLSTNGTNENTNISGAYIRGNESTWSSVASGILQIATTKPDSANATYADRGLVFGIDSTTLTTGGTAFMQYWSGNSSTGGLVINPNGGPVAVGSMQSDSNMSLIAGKNGNAYFKVQNSSGYGGGATNYTGVLFHQAPVGTVTYQKAGIIYDAYDGTGGGYGRGKLLFAVNGVLDSSNVPDTLSASTRMNIDYVDGVVTIGQGTTVGTGKLNVLSTTEQLRLNYDTSNYFSTTIGSTGATAFNSVGAGSNFSFADKAGFGSTTPISTVSIKGTAGTNLFTVASSTDTKLFEIDQGGAFYVNNSVGTAGQVLQTNGALTPPTWVTPSGGGTLTWVVESGGLRTSTSTDYAKAAYFVATSTTATSTFAGPLKMKNNLWKEHSAGFLDLQREVTDGAFTLMRIRAPKTSTGGCSQEATLSLVNDISGDNSGVNEEFIDFYNECYGDSRQWGLRQAYSGTGVPKPFVLGFWNTSGAKDAGNSLIILPGHNVGLGMTATSSVNTSSILHIASSTATYLTKWDATAGTNLGVFTSTGRFGVGSTTPAYKFVVASSSDSIYMSYDPGASATSDLFQIASTTGTTLFSVGAGGHIRTGGGTPVVSACGTTPSISGNDTAGTVTVGTGVVTACTITFSVVRAATPRVVGVVTGGGLSIAGGYSAKSTSAVTFSFAATVAGGTFDYLIVE